ncbi:MAG: hypothetical protein ACNS61_17015, partial [Candidatus Wenzhouxiangella sp. M2_3B_020]
ATLVHDPLVLGTALLAALALQGRAAASILRQALVAVVLVNATVSVAWVVAAVWHGEPWMTLVLRLNLRVLLIAVLTFTMVRHVDILEAVEFAPRLKFLVVLALGQVRMLSQLLAQYRDAFASRSPTRPRLRLRFASAGRQAAAMLEKAEMQADELNQGMRARGFFDDRA